MSAVPDSPAPTGSVSDPQRPHRGQFFAQLAARRPDIALCKASLFAVRTAEEAASAHGITLAQHMILQMLEAAGPASQQALSDELRIDRSTMVRCIDALEKAGSVRRHRDAADRRAYSVHITESGRTVLAEAEQEVPDVLNQTLAPLTDKERADLTRLLAKLATGTPH
jgi:DNA-binding MarR family transcriptional regulator